MEEKVIIAKFGKTKVAQTEKQWRYNHGQKLKFEGVDLPANYEVHFSNSKTGTAKTVIGNADGALIPQEYFVPGSMIYAWVYVEEDGVGVTKREVRIPIDQKARPTDQQPLPEEQTIIEQAIEALNDAVEEIPAEITAALAAAKEAGTFDGTNIWWTYDRILNALNAELDYDGAIRKRDLHGKEGEELLVGDLVYGPGIQSNNVITDLYIIEYINGPLVYVNRLAHIVGDDGFSPVVDIEPILHGHRVTITDAGGPDSFDVMDGVVEIQGPLSMEDYRITDLADGINDHDAVNKAQVARMVGDGSGLFRGSFQSKQAMNAVPWQSTNPDADYYVDNNDICVVQSDESQHYECWRYSYTKGSGWAAQYRINESPMTTAQIAAINSGITADRLVSLEQFKNTAQPKLNGIETGAQVNKIEAIRVLSDITGIYEELPIINKKVDIPRQGATVFDFVYDEDVGEMVLAPTLDEVQEARPGSVARFKFRGVSDEIYIPLVDNIGDFFGVVSNDTAYIISYYNSQWNYEEQSIGGSGGTSDYTELTNKPQINGATLDGNKSLSDLGAEPEALVVTVTESGGIYSADQTYSDTSAAIIAGKRVVAVLDGCEYQLFSGTQIPYAIVFSANVGNKAYTIILLSNDTITVSSTTLGTYSKPSGGIPATDLEEAVRILLGKADTALQSYTETDPTVPSWAKESSKPSYSASEVGAVALEQGVAHAGEFVVVGSDGNITTMTLATWQGGNY